MKVKLLCGQYNGVDFVVTGIRFESQNSKLTRKYRVTVLFNGRTFSETQDLILDADEVTRLVEVEFTDLGQSYMKNSPTPRKY